MNRKALIRELQEIVWIRKLRNRKNLAVLLAFVTFVAILSVAYCLPTSSLVIGNTGIISLSGVTAKSGSPVDIQTAVNAIVALGGGTVYVPAGTFTFNPPMNGTGVTIPFATVPINIIGAGIGVTILKETTNDGNSTMFARTWNGQNYNGSAVRISGISFVGLVNYTVETSTSNIAVYIKCTQDFRIDHCSFQDFEGTAIFVTDGTGSYTLVNRGVIDHCTFDDPYRIVEKPHNATGNYYAVWGYGIIVLGDYMSWDTNIGDYLGAYYPTATTNSTNCPTGTYGAIVPQPIYIEYCNFTRIRHAISGNAGGFYVARYDYFCDAFYGQCDMHGDTGNPAPYNFGTRASEVYSCIFNLTDESYSDGQDDAWRVRGGGGVFWNNTIYLNSNYPTVVFRFFNDGEPAPYSLNQVYIWNNVAIWTNGTVTDGTNSINLENSGAVLNVNYFFRAPDQADDGFTYAPYRALNP